jgi:radical SAM superfamily enzyme YgiQ (UPF0313 family)
LYDMKADVLLLRPPGKKTDSRLYAMEQLGLSYIAAVARGNGLAVVMIDGFLEPERYSNLLSTIDTHDYHLIGYPIYHETLQRVASDVNLMRQRGVKSHITVGNYLATLYSEQILQEFPGFDSAIRGEGEFGITELVQRIASGEDLSTVAGLTYRRKSEIVLNPPRPNIQDLDALPFPARDTLALVLTSGNAPLIYSSRGCNARCEYCSVHKFYRSSPHGFWRARSPENVVDEMEQLADEFGVREFAFADEQFMGHGEKGVQRALGIAAELIQRRLDFHWYIETRSSDVTLPIFARLREAGLRAVFMGIESGYDPALRAFKKGLTVDQHRRAVDVLKTLQIVPTIGFIMFRPETTLEELRVNLAFLEEIACGEITALTTQLKVYAGTDLEQSLRRTNRLQGSYPHYGWQFADSRVAECFTVVMNGAESLATSYNEFARIRRLGILTYDEALALQRVMNSGPIGITRNIIKAVAEEGLTATDLIRSIRLQFDEACEDFLALLRFTEVVAGKRQRQDGLTLLNPMSLC